MKKLFLIDAYALIFRFHYAFVNRPFRNARGENISAVFGFVKFLNELIESQQPDLLGVAFDPRGGNFRHELFPQYKANRSATPEDIVRSVPIIKEILAARNIPILEVAGYEADDVIGTLSYKASLAGEYTTFMVTPDKDYGQLIRPNVFMYKPAKGDSGVDRVGMDNICEQYCICDPMLIIDILALWGDASDNIPGVPGIGEKGACKLVGAWGTVENIIEHADSLPPKQRQSILDNREQLLLSKRLTTIVLDVPIEFEPERLVMEEPDISKLRALYKAQGFNMFLRELDSLDFHNASQGTDGGIAIRPYSAKLEGQQSLFGDPMPVAPGTGSRSSSSYGSVVSDSSSVPTVSSTDTDTDVDAEAFATIRNTEHFYEVVGNVEKLEEMVSVLKEQSVVCFDTETTSLNPLDCKLVGISFAYREHHAFWVPVDGTVTAGNNSTPAMSLTVEVIMDAVRSVLEDPNIIKVGQNLKYDIRVLNKFGVQVLGELRDTMIVHYLLDSQGRHSMDSLSRQYLDYSPMPIDELIGKGAAQITMDRVAPHLVAAYAAEDADITLQLYNKLWPLLVERGDDEVNLYSTVEEPLIATLARIEDTGVTIDCRKLADSAKVLNAKMAEMELEIRKMTGSPELNINSPKQLGQVLFEDMGIGNGKMKRTKTGQYKTDEQTLEQFAATQPVVALLLEYRGIKKLVSTYIEALPALISPITGRLHTSFNQAVTTTGRLSSNNPNLQNIPIREELGRQIREAFVAPGEGWSLMAADYSQVELRIMAHLSGDHNLQQAFICGEDVHTATAAKIFGVDIAEVTSEQRRQAKMANFGIIYGISSFGLAQRLGVPMSEASVLIKGYFELYPGVKLYMDQVIADAKEQGYVQTMFGRRRYLDQINSSNAMMRGLAERNAINAPIQGAAADIIKLAMTKLDRALLARGYSARILMQVHDELVLEVPNDEIEKVRGLVDECMSHAAELAVPLVVDIGVGFNWLTAH